MTDSILGDLNRFFVVGFSIDFDAHLLPEHLQLVNSGRTIHVTSSQQRFLTAFRFQKVGKFRTVGGLTGTLQTGHQDDGR